MIPTLVVGFGNSLMGDDGVGAAVVAELDDIGAPPGLRLSTLADVLHLPSAWRGEARVWMVDAVIRGAAPGAVHRRGHAEVLENPQRHATVHHLSLAEGLRWILHSHPAMAGVRFRLWGVEPESVEPVEALTRISHQLSSRGRRGAVPSGVCDPRGAERVLAVRRAPRGEKTQLGAVHRRPQQEAGEICGLSPVVARAAGTVAREIAVALNERVSIDQTSPLISRNPRSRARAR